MWGMKLAAALAVVAAATTAQAQMTSGSGAAGISDLSACSSADPTKALAACTRIIQSKGSGQAEALAGAFRNRGFIYQSRGDTARAIDDYDATIKLGPSVDNGRQTPARARPMSTAGVLHAAQGRGQPRLWPTMRQAIAARSEGGGRLRQPLRLGDQTRRQWPWPDLTQAARQPRRPGLPPSWSAAARFTPSNLGDFDRPRHRRRHRRARSQPRRRQRLARPRAGLSAQRRHGARQRRSGRGSAAGAIPRPRRRAPGPGRWPCRRAAIPTRPSPSLPALSPSILQTRRPSRRAATPIWRPASATSPSSTTARPSPSIRAFRDAYMTTAARPTSPRHDWDHAVADLNRVIEINPSPPPSSIAARR